MHKNLEFNIQDIVDKMQKEFDIPEEPIFNMLHTYASDIESMLLDLKSAIDILDFKEIYNISHKIKGSSGSLQLDSVYKASCMIEQDASNKIEADYIKNYELIRDYSMSLVLVMNDRKSN